MPSCVPVLARFCPEVCQCLIHFPLHHPLMDGERMPLMLKRVGGIGLAPVVENEVTVEANASLTGVRRSGCS